MNVIKINNQFLVINPNDNFSITIRPDMTYNLSEVAKHLGITGFEDKTNITLQDALKISSNIPILNDFCYNINNSVKSYATSSSYKNTIRDMSETIENLRNEIRYYDVDLKQADSDKETYKENYDEIVEKYNEILNKYDDVTELNEKLKKILQNLSIDNAVLTGKIEDIYDENLNINSEHDDIVHELVRRRNYLNDLIKNIYKFFNSNNPIIEDPTKDTNDDDNVDLYVKSIDNIMKSDKIFYRILPKLSEYHSVISDKKLSNKNLKNFLENPNYSLLRKISRAGITADNLYESVRMLIKCLRFMPLNSDQEFLLNNTEFIDEIINNDVINSVKDYENIDINKVKEFLRNCFDISYVPSDKDLNYINIKAYVEMVNLITNTCNMFNKIRTSIVKIIIDSNKYTEETARNKHITESVKEKLQIYNGKPIFKIIIETIALTLDKEKINIIPFNVKSIIIIILNNINLGKLIDVDYNKIILDLFNKIGLMSNKIYNIPYDFFMLMYYIYNTNFVKEPCTVFGDGYKYEYRNLNLDVHYENDPTDYWFKDTKSIESISRSLIYGTEIYNINYRLTPDKIFKFKIDNTYDKGVFFAKMPGTLYKQLHSIIMKISSNIKSEERYDKKLIENIADKHIYNDEDLSIQELHGIFDKLCIQIQKYKTIIDTITPKDINNLYFTYILSIVILVYIYQIYIKYHHDNNLTKSMNTNIIIMYILYYTTINGLFIKNFLNTIKLDDTIKNNYTEIIDNLLNTYHDKYYENMSETTISSIKTIIDKKITSNILTPVVDDTVEHNTKNTIMKFVTDYILNAKKLDTKIEDYIYTNNLTEIKHIINNYLYVIFKFYVFYYAIYNVEEFRKTLIINLAKNQVLTTSTEKLLKHFPTTYSMGIFNDFYKYAFNRYYFKGFMTTFYKFEETFIKIVAVTLGLALSQENYTKYLTNIVNIYVTKFNEEVKNTAIIKDTIIKGGCLNYDQTISKAFIIALVIMFIIIFIAVVVVIIDNNKTRVIVTETYASQFRPNTQWRTNWLNENRA